MLHKNTHKKKKKINSVLKQDKRKKEKKRKREERGGKKKFSATGIKHAYQSRGGNREKMPEEQKPRRG